MKHPTAATCGRQLLLAIPPLMQDIRHAIRTSRDPELTLPQFRALSAVERSPGICLAAVALHVGLGAPSTSVLIDGLARRRLLVRQSDATNRRKVRLEIRPAGQAALERARDSARTQLEQRLKGLSPAELAALDAGIAVLARVFIPAEPTAPASRVCP
jgi:DNA-binding MarR family transcriptional regulator